MPKYTSIEKRNDIISHKMTGKRNDEIAENMNVCIRTVQRVWAEYKAKGSSEAKVHNCGRKPSITPEKSAKILQKIKEAPNATLKGLIEEFDLRITQAGLSKHLKNMGLSVKSTKHPIAQS